MPATPSPRRKTIRPSVEPKRVYLSLGSNLGDSLALIRQAIKMLPGAGIQVRRISSFYKTEPVDFLLQSWFINCAAEVETELSPRRLFRALESVERKLGRRGGAPKGPRLIDIDILLYENIVVRSPGLTIPHAHMPDRRFVLIPLREIAPRARHPVTQQTVSQMLRETTDASKVIKFKKN